MSVLLADRRLSLRRQLPMTLDSHGEPVSGGWTAAVGPWPGRAVEGPDSPFGEPGGRAWTVAFDARGWPMTQGDLIVDADSGEEWLVTSADLQTNNADSYVDYVRIEAHLFTTGTWP